MGSTVSVALLNRMRVRAGLDPLSDEILLDAVRALAYIDQGVAGEDDQPAVVRSAGGVAVE